MLADEMIIIKSDYILRGIIEGKYPPILIEMMFEVIHEIKDCGVTPVITSAFREGDSGVHGFYRGIDFRSWGLTKQHCDIIVEIINRKYIYDKNRSNKKVLIFHDTGRGPHLHLQSHPNTFKK